MDSPLVKRENRDLEAFKLLTLVIVVRLYVMLGTPPSSIGNKVQDLFKGSRDLKSVSMKNCRVGWSDAR